jgi:hypothetical protein
MTAQLEHQIWSEDDFLIHCCVLNENPLGRRPGSVAIQWLGAGGEHKLELLGNKADDFLERYRAAPDNESREHLMIYEIRKAVEA